MCFRKVSSVRVSRGQILWWELKHFSLRSVKQMTAYEICQIVPRTLYKCTNFADMVHLHYCVEQHYQTLEEHFGEQISSRLSGSKMQQNLNVAVVFVVVIIYTFTGFNNSRIFSLHVDARQHNFGSPVATVGWKSNYRILKMLWTQLLYTKHY